MSTYAAAGNSFTETFSFLDRVRPFRYGQALRVYAEFQQRCPCQNQTVSAPIESFSSASLRFSLIS
jgi:hypothetical protein